MTISVIQPTFFVNLNSPTEVKYQIEDILDVSDWRMITVQNWQFGCPAPGENEILYQFSKTRGCIVKTPIERNGPTAIKRPPVLKNEPATPAKRSTPDEIKF